MSATIPVNLASLGALADPVPVGNGGTGVATAVLGAGALLANSAVVLGTATGCQLATAANQKISFHGATRVVQRDSSAVPAVVTTAATQTTPFGFATGAQADALVALVNELRAALVEKGIIKGS